MPRMKTLKRPVSNKSLPKEEVKPAKRRRALSKTENNDVNHKTESETSEVTLLPIPSVQSGVILSFGSGDVGQLGLGEDVMEKLRPALIPNVEDVIQIEAGGMHSVCLKSNGEVLSWGCNDEGALGRQGPEAEPRKVDLPEPAVMISAGDSHSAALLQDGRVFAWGSFRDASGNMGLLNVGTIEKTPVDVLQDIFSTKIASGADHLVILTKKGQIYTFGCGQQGQLGRLSNRETSRERRQGIASSLHPGVVQFRHKEVFTDIWAGTYGTFVKNKDKEVWVFGLNNYQQIGLPNLEPYFRPVKSTVFGNEEWIKICSGLHHTLALNFDGKIFALGRKEYGRLGLGENCEDAKELTPIPKLESKKVVDIACGSTTSFAVLDNGEVYSWGMGTGGALGTGEEDDVYEPQLIRGKQLLNRLVYKVASGGQHTIILASTTQNNNIEPENKTD